MNIQNHIELEHTLTRVMYIKLNLFITLRKWYVYLITGVAVFLLIISLINDYNPLLPALIIVFCLLYSPIYALYLAFNSKNNFFFLPASFVFTEENISVKTPLIQSIIKWDIFHKWNTVNGYYILNISTQFFTAIPKSTIPVQDILSFESLLRSKIKSKQ